MRRSQPTKKIEIWIVILEMSSQIDSSNRSFCWAKHIREINQHKIYHTGNTLFDSHPNSGTNNILFRVREYFTIMLDSFILLNAILYYISTLTFIFLNIIWKIKLIMVLPQAELFILHIYRKSIFNNFNHLMFH